MELKRRKGSNTTSQHRKITRKITCKIICRFEETIPMLLKKAARKRMLLEKTKLLGRSIVSSSIGTSTSGSVAAFGNDRKIRSRHLVKLLICRQRLRENVKSGSSSSNVFIVNSGNSNNGSNGNNNSSNNNSNNNSNNSNNNNNNIKTIRLPSASFGISIRDSFSAIRPPIVFVQSHLPTCLPSARSIQIGSIIVKVNGGYVSSVNDVVREKGKAGESGKKWVEVVVEVPGNRYGRGAISHKEKGRVDYDDDDDDTGGGCEADSNEVSDEGGFGSGSGSGGNDENSKIKIYDEPTTTPPNSNPTPTPLPPPPPPPPPSSKKDCKCTWCGGINKVLNLGVHQKVSERSERALWKTSILSMKCANDYRHKGCNRY